MRKQILKKYLWVIVLWVFIMSGLLVGLARAQSDSLTLPQQKQEEKKPPVIDKQFIMVNSYLIAMTVFDVESTFGAIRNGAHEANPIMKPFVNSGRAATYGIELGIDAVIIFVAYGSKRTGNKSWWVLPVVAGTAHGVCGGFNMRYAW